MTATEVKAALANRAEEFVSWLFPAGRKNGGEWQVGSLRGEAGKSLNIRIAGAKVGVFKDFASGEHGDNLVELYVQARGVDFTAAMHTCADWLGVAVTRNHYPAVTRTAPPTQPARAKPALPAMDDGCDEELRALAKARNISYAAAWWARSVGLLRFATLNSHRAWVVTDDDRLNAQARQLDGGLWEHIGGKKAYTLPGSWASWPIGTCFAKAYPKVLVVEGGPDLLAALHFLRERDEPDACPVAMLGSSNNIHAGALQTFAGKICRIYTHADEQGEKAAGRWTEQLLRAGAAHVDGFSFRGLRTTTGSQIKDLNDATQIHDDEAAEIRGLLP